MTLEPGGIAAGEETAGPVAALAPAPAEAAGSASGRARGHVLRAAWEFLHDLSVAVLFCFFLIAFVAQAFRVQGTSMEPLLLDGERIVVNKFVYRFQPIERGDVVVFWYPRDPSVSFIKRVVGLPGRPRRDARRPAPRERHAGARRATCPRASATADNYPPTEVRKGYYFVLGDHRRSSNDSRTWGEVPEKYIYGRAVFRFWPFDRVGPIR